MARLIMAVVAIASLSGCATRIDPACGPGYGPPVTIFTLFFGEAVPGRDDLTDDEWRAFLDATITPNLPNGYTVYDARGGWMNPITRRTIKENTKVLLVALPEQTLSLAAINRIRTAYQIKFQQQLVGMTAQHACGAF